MIFQEHLLIELNKPKEETSTLHKESGSLILQKMPNLLFILFVKKLYRLH